MNAPQDLGAVLEAREAEVEMERQLLGELMMDSAAAWPIALETGLTNAHFSTQEHAAIFGAIGVVVGRRQSADIVTVFQTLGEQGAQQRAGGLAYINSLADMAFTVRHVGQHAMAVVQNAKGRRLQSLAAALSRNANDAGIKELVRSALEADEAMDVQHGAARQVDPLSVLGQWLVTDEQVQNMQDTRIIFPPLIGHQHLAVWSAVANAGKTQLAKYAAGELARNFTVMFFQEDASAGDLPALHAHAKEHGYSLLNSTLAGSSPEDQIRALGCLARDAADLSGCVLFFDTLKKFVDLMSKGGTRGFFKLMRALTQRGATVILLGHTNKHKSHDGKLVFEGVGDVRNDVDELIYMESTPKADDGTVTMTMKPDKVRCAIKEATFVLDTNTMTVRPAAHVVDVGALLAGQRQRLADESVIASIRASLAGGGMPFETLRRAVMAATGEGRNRVGQVIEAYCSDDPLDESAMWVHTRLRTNNARHISLKPGGAL